MSGIPIIYSDDDRSNCTSTHLLDHSIPSVLANQCFSLKVERDTPSLTEHNSLPNVTTLSTTIIVMYRDACHAFVASSYFFYGFNLNLKLVWRRLDSYLKRSLNWPMLARNIEQLFRWHFFVRFFQNYRSRWATLRRPISNLDHLLQLLLFRFMRFILQTCDLRVRAPDDPS